MNAKVRLIHIAPYACKVKSDGKHAGTAQVFLRAKVRVERRLKGVRSPARDQTALV